jgi:hypothetical protein
VTVRQASLTQGDRTYFSDEPSGNQLHADTAVTRLIEGIWDRFPEQAFHLLRSRIYTNYPLTLRCKGAIQLAAKRVSVLPPEEYATLRAANESAVEVNPRASVRIPVELPRHPSPAELARFIQAFPFPTADRPILAVLADAAGAPLLAAPNTSSSNRLRHAEVNLVREYVHTRQRLIPSGATLWVSLKPCRMCAGFIHDLSEDGARTQVRYLVDDPGPKARNSPLTLLSRYQPD